MSARPRPWRPDHAIEFPPGVNRDAVLGRLNSAAWMESPHFRRMVTEFDPVRFALTYLTGDPEDGRPNHLASRQTGDRISFSLMHMHMAAGARRWAADEVGPIREGWIAPRGAAKSTWTFLILPLWALAHGHRRYVYALADASAQAEAHLATLRMELERNRLLLQDFPELEPAPLRGSRNTARDLDLAGGGAMAARGMDSRTLGAKVGSERPDLIVGDDLEPGASTYSVDAKAKRLGTLVNEILPMNDQAVVQLAGTVTMWGSIMHDLVLAALGGEVAEWIRFERFRPRYYPPIVLDPDTGLESSCWPARWSLRTLEERRALGGLSWSLNFANQPPRPGDGGIGWVPDLFVRRDPPVAFRSLFVDVAVTSRATSDQTALAVIGPTTDRKQAVVDYVRGFRGQPAQIRTEVQSLARKNGIRDVYVEVNQGGDVWREILRPLPPGVRLHLIRTTTPKRDRIANLLDAYGRGMVLHPRPLGELERQMLDHPGKHDDLIDVVGIGVGTLLENAVRL